MAHDPLTEKEARRRYQDRLNCLKERVRQTVDARHAHEAAKRLEAEAAGEADAAYLELREAIRREALQEFGIQGVPDGE